MATQSLFAELTDYVPTVLNFSPLRLTDEQFESLCRNHPDLNLEMSAEGELIIVPPTSPDTGWRNANLIFQVGDWAEKDKTGIAFDSSTMFTLPNGAKRSPDFAWITNERWNGLTEDEQERFPPLCPDFVVELRSRTDTLKNLRQKMEEYMANGAQLGWLIDPQERRVYVYRPGAAVEGLDDPRAVSGEPLLRGLELELEEIWD